MNTDRRTSITISIIIRRIFAIFLFTSIASGIITDFLYGNITSDSVFGAIVGLVIVFFLFRRPRKFKTVSNEEVKGNTVEEDKDIYDEETLKEFEKFDYELNDVNDVVIDKKSFSPVKDEENILSRMLRGRTDRY
tara:strand:+ start:82 stop:486 length:405 start_codon:yes stop_codon:yes gene_type:complete